jgi:CubicO group peptidase (beta-lactamase class C family)
MPVTDLTARRLRAALAEEQVHGRVPSLVAALTRDGVLEWRGSYGEVTGAGDTPAVDLQYRVGSITKTMTAVLVLQLEAEGRVSLSDPLGRHVPGTAYDDRTLRELLAHSGGLPAEPPGDWWERVDGGPFDALAATLGEASAAFPASETFHYSNLGYGLLGEVVARTRGRTWWECLCGHLLEPLGMLRTTYDPYAPHAQGWSVDPGTGEVVPEPHTDTGSMAAAGQVWSTVMDLTTFADLLVRGHREVLPADALERMCTPQSGTAAGGLATAYGLGVRLFRGGSGTLVGHTGSMPGFQATLLVDRPRRAGGVALANSTTGPRLADLVVRLLDRLQAEEPLLPEPWLPSAEVPDVVREVVGTWHWGNTPIDFVWQGDVLVSRHRTGELHGTWGVSGDVPVGLSGYHHGEPLEVVRGEDGSVSHLVVSTFVLTRTPYDPRAPIPGGPPVRGPH